MMLSLLVEHTGTVGELAQPGTAHCDLEQITFSQLLM